LRFCECGATDAIHTAARVQITDLVKCMSTSHRE
jgi:hypothetical protein